MRSISETLAFALEHHQGGRLDAAEQLYRQVLQLDPDQAQALNLLGLLLHQQGHHDQAIRYLRQAITCRPDYSEAHSNLGLALTRAGLLNEAVACFRQAVRLMPHNAVGHSNLGLALAAQGQLEEAIGCYREALRRGGERAMVYSALGEALYALGRKDEAIAAYEKVIRLRPQWPEVLSNLGNLLRLTGRLEGAVIHLQEALRLNPNLGDAHLNLGAAYHAQGLLDQAIAHYRQAAQLQPELAEVHYGLGTAFAAVGLLDEAVTCFKQALRLSPNYALAYNNLGNARKDQGQIEEAVTCYRQAVRLQPDKQEWVSNLLYSLTFHPAHNAPAILEEHRRWERNHLFAAPSHANEPSPRRRLRIGYVSPDFRDHVVGRNVWPLLRNHDRQQFEITLYANVARPDAMTEQFRRCAHTLYNIAGWPEERLAETIRQDGIDILVDLALHMADSRVQVFARKLAPVQVTFAGYPGTTGLSAIDYRLTDPYLDPPGQHEDWYAEQSVRLPDSFWCYDPQTDEPPVGPLPALKNGFVTFGSLNNFCKVNEGVLELWAQVLRAVGNARLLLLAKQGSHRQRTIDFLARRGVAPEHVAFCKHVPPPEYLALYHQLDIALDTFPYNGHTTSLDAFWMGVPVITRVGNTVVGRAGLSQLTNLGLPELAATTPDQFVRLAVHLAEDLPRLQQLRSGLRERMQQSPLMDATGFARAVEEAYRTMWRTWCAQRRGTPA